jgi:hypothetical protein
MPPNSANNFFGVKVSKAGIPVNQASDRQLVYKDDFSTKTYFDTTNSRMLEGLLPDGTYGLWVSKPGFDVSTSTPSQRIFDSNRDIFNIVSTATATVTVPNSIVSNAVVTTTVAHGLSVVPAFMAFVSVPVYGGFVGAGQLTNLPGLVIGTIGSSAGQIFLIGSVRVDSTNIYFDVTNPTANTLTGLAGVWSFKYYILQETAN